MPIGKLPKVSICLLTYNRAAALPASIDSLLAQTHEDFELIINDDRSTDATEKICLEYEGRDQRVKYYKNATNLRYAGNQNVALLRASTEYVAIVHDGDIYRADLIEKWTRALIKHPTAALVFNALETMDGGGNPLKTYIHPYREVTPGLELFDEMIRRPDSPIFGIVMLRKSCVLSVGPFDPRIPTLADIDMWLRLLLRYDVAYLSEALLRVAPREVNHHNTSANWNIQKQHELIYSLNTARRYADGIEKMMKLRYEILPMVWRMRVRGLFLCLWHGEISAAIKGLVFMWQNRRFVKTNTSDSVLDWEAVTKCL